MTRLSGSGTGGDAPRRGAATVQAAPRRSPGLARRLLYPVAMTLMTSALSACPLPDWEPQENVNLPLLVDERLAQPPPDLLTQVCAGDSVTLDISNAVDDPQGDRVFVFWYVNYIEGQSVPISASDVEEFTFVPCQTLNSREGLNEIEVFMMDRPPVAFNPDGARQVSEDGDLRRMYWMIPVGEGCCSLPVGAQ